MAQSKSALIIQHDPISGPGTLEQCVRDAGWQVDYWFPYKGQQPPSLDGVNAVLAFGGRVSPDDEEAQGWMDQEREVLAAAVERDLALLGVCLGGELLAQVVGGDMSSEAPKQVGWRGLEPDPDAADDPVFGELPPRVFEWHYNGIDAPPEASVLARSERDDQVFRGGERAWGVQFHPEIDLALVDVLIAVQGEHLDEVGADPEQVRDDTAAAAHDYVAWAHGALGRFLRVAAD